MSVKRGPKKASKPILDQKLDFLTFLELWNLKLGQTTPLHHKQIAQWLVDTQGNAQRLLQAFRESGKSWIVCLYVTWRLYMDPMDTFVLVSATQPLATRNANFIREMIENHPLTKHMVPPGETELWRRQSFTVVRPHPDPNPSVQAVALGGDFTGLHGKNLIADDCETSRNSETTESRAQTRDRINEFPSISRRILWVGTPHAGQETIYAPMIANPARFNPIQIPIYIEDEDGSREYAWPELFDEERCIELEQSMSVRHFQTQYLLQMVNMEASGLPVEFIRSYSESLETERHTSVWHDNARVSARLLSNQLVKLIAVYDPATALPGKDDSVCCIMAQDQDKRVYLHRAIALPPISPEIGYQSQTDEIVKLMKELGVVQIAVETNLSKSIDVDLNASARKFGHPIRIKKIHSNSVSKVSRIAVALESLMGSGKFYAHESVLNTTPFKQQAMDFPASVKRRGAKDDFLDCAALGVGVFPEIGAYTGQSASGTAQVTSYRLASRR